MKIITICIMALLIASTSFAARKFPEQYYQNKWCTEQSGDSEVVLEDGTRCDCLINGNLGYAVEVEFGNKFYESAMQALHYSMLTNQKAGIVLILESRKDYKYWIRLNTIIEHFNLPIETWKVENY